MAKRKLRSKTDRRRADRRAALYERVKVRTVGYAPIGVVGDCIVNGLSAALDNFMERDLDPDLIDAIEVTIADQGGGTFGATIEACAYRPDDPGQHPRADRGYL